MTAPEPVAEFTALIHTGCGHIAGMADTPEMLHAMEKQAEHFGLADPPWKFVKVEDLDDALVKLLEGPCSTCMIERIP